MKRYDTEFLLTNPDSLLTHLNLKVKHHVIRKFIHKEILNVKTFGLLSPAEKDQLLQHLPSIDCTSKKSIESTFTSNAFHQSLQSFQEMLEAGEFEEGADYLSYLKGKKKREKSETWKVSLNQFSSQYKEKYYEEYWGQKSELRHEFFDSGNYGPNFSFVQHAKEHPEEQAPINEPIVLGKVVENPPPPFVEDIVDLDFVYDESEDDFVDPAAKRKRKYQPEPEEEDDLEEELEDDEDELMEEKVVKKRKSTNDGTKSLKGDSFKMTAYTILKREGKPLSAGKIVKIGLKEGRKMNTQVII